MKDPRISHVVTKLAQSLGDSWSVEKMAAFLGMSTSNFQRVFRDELKTSPMAYFHSLRLEKASEMLADPECFQQIKAIAYSVGLNDNSHFTRDFKKRFGATPTEYRRHHANIHQSASPDGHE